MDIASLLSDGETPQQNPSSSHNSNQNSNQNSSRKRPRPAAGTRTTSLLSQEVLITPSPEPPRPGHQNGQPGVQQYPHTAIPPQQGGNAGSQHYTTDARMSVSAAVTPTAEPGSPFGTPPPQHRPSLLSAHRNSSMSNVDIMSDISTKVQPGTPHTMTPRPDMARSPSLAHVRQAPPNVRTHSASDLVMAEAPAQTPPPRSFSAASLSEADAKTIQELTTYLADNSYDYNSHVQLINLLHRGFAAHSDTRLNERGEPSDPAEYPWLKELRMARSAMDSRYAVGEDIWRDWINDESVLAHSSEDRSAVMELCMKAVQEEPASVVLWSLYGEWVWSTYAVSNGYMEGDEDTWTEEDKLICKEVFSREMVLSVWSQAVEATKWRMDESHVVWNRYAELVMQDLPEEPSAQTIEEVQLLFMNRLQIPHAHWEGTSQAFWPFISKHKADSWEEVMSATNEMAAPAKDDYSKRETLEVELTRAFRTNDNVALYNAFAAYLAWESKYKKKRSAYEKELRCGLYERALLRFPTLVEWWLDYVDYLTSFNAAGTNILPLLERATRHCPWSGELWARRLLRVELDLETYDEVEGVKHKATNSGLLPTGGMEEILLVYAAWCSYLRRRAFTKSATDDDVDMAEMAIAECLNDVENHGKKAYGDDFKGDPLWRIEKIFIKFLTQARRMQEARDQWTRLVPLQGHSYDFWAQYYEWEIFVWGAERTVFNLKIEAPETAPHLASEVLREAMKQKNLDWPEKIHQLYAHHFQTHESPVMIQKAQIDLRRSQKALKVRREREAEVGAAEAQVASQAVPQPASLISEESVFSAKRKREYEPATNGDSAKRNKTEEIAPDEVPTEPSASASAQIKRDREHNTITVQNLPLDVDEKRLRQFFGDCGTIFSINIVKDAQGSSSTATIEFETHEDVVTARTRDGKSIDGHEIQIKSGTQTTLYVTNYPPSYAENEIRDLFSYYGTIASIRFPSLKFNQRRRFCYVQYTTAQEAQAATQLHNKAIDGSSRLVALISDPDAKKQRQGAISEGREVHIANIDHDATEKDIRELFSEAGEIESLRMMRSATGKFTGSAFIIYTSADGAQDALKLNNKPHMSRIIRVTLATDKTSRDAANKKHGTTKIFDAAGGKSASPGPEGASAGSPSAETESADTARTKRERSIALLNLPDTVNDVRVHDFFVTFGPIRKLTIRRDKAGAIIEFVNVADAGKVGMNIDASALGPECKVGDVPTLLYGNKKGGEKKDGGATLIRPATVSRPVQQSRGRGGRRGGLGFKRGGAAMESKGRSDAPQGKTNEDFKQMFLAGKTEGQE
ncbi:RNA recognition motif-containing protein 14 [Elsinoe fawcettii]|nr:RNA recognition motif-containing protein 14 [Elsinoe fawcettii]